MSRPDTKLIGQADSFLHTLDQVSHLTHIDRPILIVGERGTGKELIAERLHYLSNRWDKPFIKLNCAAMHESLLESELFGHEAGAFTGATKRHIGRFERSQGGSLFLDELATLANNAQEKLLRVIEYGEFERLGGSETILTDTRLIAATNDDLPSLALEGEFRHDLLDRLAFDVITIPPLRARQEDIVLLAEHFAIKMCKELQRPYFPGFSPKAVDTLLNYHWPGNVRELKNAVERSVYRHENNEVVKQIYIDPFASPYRLTKTPQSNNSPQPNESPAGNTTTLTQTTPQLPTDYYQQRNQLEIHLLQTALNAAQYNQKEAAQLLKLSYHQFRSQLKKHKINT